MELQTKGHAPVNGLQMYYEIYGEDTVPLVLIHGGGSTIESTFGNMLPVLAKSGKVIAVELQAHGRTSDRPAPESFQQDADDVAELLKHLGIDKADILGFSNGGSTAMQVAIRHPQVVNKIVVISGAYKRDGFLPGFFDGMQHATIDHMPASLKEAYLKVNPDKSGLQTMFEKDKERMITFKDWPDEDLQNIKAPALLLSADRDVMLAEHTIQMARLIPGSRFAILPADHASIIGEVGCNSELFRVTAGIVTTFLAQ
jgi:pimeloyl-ACP methyl ester carboxylesterase